MVEQLSSGEEASTNLLQFCGHRRPWSKLHWNYQRNWVRFSKYHIGPESKKCRIWLRVLKTPPTTKHKTLKHKTPKQTSPTTRRSAALSSQASLENIDDNEGSLASSSHSTVKTQSVVVELRKIDPHAFQKGSGCGWKWGILHQNKAYFAVKKDFLSGLDR